MRRAAIALAALLLAAARDAHAQDEGTPIVGGGSFNTAPLLEPGRYADTVAAGETVYWKVALAEGAGAQGARDRRRLARSRRTTPRPTICRGSTTSTTRWTCSARCASRSATRTTPEYNKATTDLEGDDDAGAKTGEVQGPRVLGFEQILAGDFSADKFPAPGEWYLSVSVADSDTQPAEVPAELPLDLEITVEGEAQPSSADFASQLATPTPEPTEAPPQPPGAADRVGRRGRSDADDRARRRPRAARRPRPRRARRPRAAAVKVFVISDMEGVAGICRWDQVVAGKPGYEEGRLLYTEELNAAVRGAFAGGRDRRRGDGLPRRGRGPLVQQPRPRRARSAGRVRGADALDRVHRLPRAGLRRRPVHRPARDGRRRARRALAHRRPRRTGTRCTSTASRSARSASTPRCAAPGARPSRSSPATTWSARSRRRCSAPGCRRSRSRPGSAASAPVTIPPPAPARRSSTRPAPRWRAPQDAPVYDPGAPCTITVALNTADQADPYRNRGDVVVTGPRTIEATAGTWWEAWRAIYLTR